MVSNARHTNVTSNTIWRSVKRFFSKFENIIKVGLPVLIILFFSIQPFLMGAAPAAQCTMSRFIEKEAPLNYIVQGRQSHFDIIRNNKSLIAHVQDLQIYDAHTYQYARAESGRFYTNMKTMTCTGKVLNTIIVRDWIFWYGTYDVYDSEMNHAAVIKRTGFTEYRLQNENGYEVYATIENNWGWWYNSWCVDIEHRHPKISDVTLLLFINNLTHTSSLNRRKKNKLLKMIGSLM
jgi:hypothetical protein